MKTYTTQQAKVRVLSAPLSLPPTPRPRLSLSPFGGEFLLLNVHGGEKAYWGRGRVGKGGQKNETSKQAPTRKTKAAVDRRQNNKM